MIVPDLQSFALDCLVQMKVLIAFYLAYHNFSLFNVILFGKGHHRAQLSALDLWRHAIAARPELHGLARLQLCNVVGRPSHDHFSTPSQRLITSSKFKTRFPSIVHAASYSPLYAAFAGSVPAGVRT